MKWLSLLILFFFVGCSQKYFIDIFAPIEVKSIVSNKKFSLGVYDVSIPHSLEESKIFVTSNGKTILKDIYLKDEYEPFLTQRAISYLHRKFPNAQISNYPWDFLHKPKKLLKIYIDEVYVKDKIMYLFVSYVYNNHRYKIKLNKSIKNENSKELLQDFLILYDNALDKISNKL